eukprot:846281-Pyramimonas_sp.AAC.1
MRGINTSLLLRKQTCRLPTEITTTSTVHRCAANSTEPCIGRFFASFAAPAIPLIETTMVIDDSLLERFGSPASDNKLAQ